MLILLFDVGEDRYALPTDRVIEITPLVHLKKIPIAPPYVAGLMNYRGTAVPVVDLCSLIEGKPCAERLSTRIIIVHYPYSDNESRTLALIAEQVTETAKCKDQLTSSSGVLLDKTLYDQEIEIDKKGMIQWFDLKRMLPKHEINDLFQG
jgi:chemotaxis-related protein WspB